MAESMPKDNGKTNIVKQGQTSGPYGNDPYVKTKTSTTPPKPY